MASERKKNLQSYVMNYVVPKEFSGWSGSCQRGPQEELAEWLASYSVRSSSVLNYDMVTKKLIWCTAGDVKLSELPLSVHEISEAQVESNLTYSEVFKLQLNKTMPYLFRPRVEQHIEEKITSMDLSTTHHRTLTPKVILKDLLMKDIIPEKIYQLIKNNEKLKKKFDNLINKIKHDMKERERKMAKSALKGQETQSSFDMSSNPMEEELPSASGSPSPFPELKGPIPSLKFTSVDSASGSMHGMIDSRSCNMDVGSLGNQEKPELTVKSGMSQGMMIEESKFNPRTFIESYYQMMSNEIKSYVFKRNLFPKEISLYDHSFLK